MKPALLTDGEASVSWAAQRAPLIAGTVLGPAGGNTAAVGIVVDLSPRSQKPALFTDEDVAAVDREIAEASYARFAVPEPTAYEEEDIAEDIADALAREFTEPENADSEAGFYFAELPIPAAEDDRAARFGRINRSVPAAMTLAGAVSAVAFSLGAAMGDLQSGLAWSLAPGMVLAGTLIAKRRSRVPDAMTEMAFCLHAVALAKAVAAALASGSLLSPETAVAVAGAAVAAGCAAAIVHGRHAPAQKGAFQRQEPIFGAR